ncbi:MAG TPA: ribosome recycling factor [Eubacteriales bacterium]|jgi:ribosome recycling factor|nr:ribosome recycling factor [Clostridia bacterium]HRR89420.1 ribosome recycling factor [Eubacteriales bacterium]HRU84442.1 ribosome recycling factor [Eubacteriales bacterium]
MAYDIEEVDLLFMEFEENMAKTIQNFSAELMSFRIGRANPHLLNKITVPYYGADTPLNQVATISIPEARILMINAWDKSILKAIEKAILQANIGITPNNDGNVIRLVFPEVTEERRRALVKDLKRLGENSKVALRNQRRDIIDKLKKMEKSSEITEDDYDKFVADVEKKLQKSIEETDKITDAKEKEIMSV